MSRRIEWSGGEDTKMEDAEPKRRRVGAEVKGDGGYSRAYVASGGTAGRRCYVGNLAWSTSWQDLKDAFRRCGNVVHADVTMESNGRSAGWGIVEFETASEALAAIKTMNDTDLGGRLIHVREDREAGGVRGGAPPRAAPGGRGGGAAFGGRGGGVAYGGRGGGVAFHGAAVANGQALSRRCYVGNLSWNTSWQDLKDAFRRCGNVLYANVTMEENGRSAGWGIVEFETPFEAATAIQTMNDTDLGGRLLHVREDREDREAKGAFPAAAAGGFHAFHQPQGHFGGGAAHFGGGGARGGMGAAPQGSYECSRMQVVVQGLPFAYTWKELKDLFAGVGDVERADISMGTDGRSKGWGTVRFSTTAGAQRGIGRWNGRELEGRTLAVFLDKFA